jgi:hypothetical protein
VIMLKFHKLFTLKVICWITLQWRVCEKCTKKLYFESVVWNVEKRYSEWLISSRGFIYSAMWHCVTGWHSWHFETLCCSHLELLNPWIGRSDTPLKDRNHSPSDMIGWLA